MKILIFSDKQSKKNGAITKAVLLAALEKHINCEAADISDFKIDKNKLTSPDYVKTTIQYIIDEEADILLCAGQGSMKLVTEIKKQEDIRIPAGAIISDYHLSHQLCTDMDLYFVPHEDLCRKLINDGIPANRIHVTGIPVQKNFRERMGKAAARNYLVIPKNRRIYLLIPEGLTYEVIIRLSEELSKAEKEDYVLYIPTARSSLYRDKLMEYAAGQEHIRIITYTKQLNLYLESADAMLLKPDALFSTEAAVTGVPIVHLLLNAPEKSTVSDFFASHEMAVIGSSIRDTISKAKRFVEEKAMAARVVQMQYRNIYSDAADKIIDIIIRSVSTKTDSKLITQ